MGLFKSIKKAFKKVTKGIKKVFSKVGKAIKGVVKAVGKFANSKLGKIILTGAAIFTGAMAISGAISGWTGALGQALPGGGTAAASFMDKFVAGAKGFMSGLSSPIKQAKALMGGTEAVTAAGQQMAGAAGKLTQAQQGQQAVQQLAKGVPAGIDTSIAKAAAGESMIPTMAQTAAQQTAQQAPGVLTRAVPEVAKEGWLSKAGEFAKDFIMSPTGAKLVEAGGQIITGYGQGAAEEERLRMEQEFQDRYRKEWMDPNNPLAQLTRQPGFGQFGTPVGAGQQPIYNPGGPIGPGGPMTTQGAMPGEPAPAG
jgi:uncharacterized phage infection (PIP) family protein YhgE